MHGFTLLHFYDDCSAKSEWADDFLTALRACEIALLDPSCCSVKILRAGDGKIILDYDR